MFTNNPLFIKGLTIPQRISFFAVIFGWLIGFPKLIYFIMPSLMILIGGYPIGSFDFSFIWRYLMFLAVILVGFKFACRGYGRVRYDECYLKHVRRKITLPLIVQNNGKPSLTAVTNDISISGLSFTSYVPLELGATLVMEVFTPFGILVAEGEIKQMRAIGVEDSYFIGVKFTQFFAHSEDVFLQRTGKEHQESLSRWLKITAEGRN